MEIRKREIVGDKNKGQIRSTGKPVSFKPASPTKSNTVTKIVPKRHYTVTKVAPRDTTRSLKSFQRVTEWGTEVQRY